MALIYQGTPKNELFRLVNVCNGLDNLSNDLKRYVTGRTQLWSKLSLLGQANK